MKDTNTLYLLYVKKKKKKKKVCLVKYMIL